MDFRPYNPKDDRPAVLRIWREVGWSDGSPQQEKAFDYHIEAGRALLAELGGTPECVVVTAPAAMRYLEQDLATCIVASVATSHVGRKRGLAIRLAAQAVAQAAAEGALVAALGMFEQGFYDRLGFGTGSYEHWVAFDPAELKVAVKPRLPRRLTHEDWEAAHAARLARWRGHGAVSLLPAGITRAGMHAARNGFGFGYRDGPGGSLSHCLWGNAENLGRGPYRIWWLAYRTGEQFLELMALVKSLGDQVRQVQMVEPPEVQVQDLLHKPFRTRQLSERSPFEAGMRASAWWQARICDLAGCLQHTHLAGPAVRFNLRLSDPIGRYLGPDAPWRGVAGEWVVTLGPCSAAEPGVEQGLPTLVATVNAFTRLWLGVVPASGLAITDALSGPQELLAALEAALRLPRPMPGWMF